MSLKKQNVLFLSLICIAWSFSFAVDAKPNLLKKPLQKQSTQNQPDATEDDFEAAPPPIKDPLEKINRPIFKFNDTLDKHVLQPVSEVYNKIMPLPLNNSINRIFKNFGTITTTINDLAQGNYYQATNDSWRLVVNSTVGIGGALNPASAIGLKSRTQDFGLTFAKWGYKNSTFVMLPFWGPKTVRDTISLPLDYYTNPYSQIDNPWYRNTVGGLKVIDSRASLLRFQSVYDEMALDPYTLVKNVYMQHRNYRIKQNENKQTPANNQDRDNRSQIYNYLTE